MDAPINWLATSLFGLACLLVGALVTWLLVRRRLTATPRNSELLPLDDQTDREIDDLAWQWAERSGRAPADAGIVASYAKLATRLQRRFVNEQLRGR